MCIECRRIFEGLNEIILSTAFFILRNCVCAFIMKVDGLTVHI